MGAKARAWVNRGFLVAAILAGIGLILALPGIGTWEVGTWTKIAILALGAAIGVFVAFKEIPAFDPLGRVRWRLPHRNERTCAITFDDGPSASTLRVVEILDRHDVKATFFVLAANARRHPDVLRTLVARGHTVAVHGVTHRKIHRDDEASIARTLSDAMTELTAFGAPPARLYRPPHGMKSAAALRAARQAGCELWAWSRGIWDTDRPAPEVLVKRATRFACARMVLLLHDGRGDEENVNIEPMLAALPLILERLRAKGFSFLTLDRA